jgi:hypothetical protein
MSDETLSEIDQTLPLIPTLPDDNDESDPGSGGPAVALLQPGNVDPRSLPGSFFFLIVTPKKRQGAAGEPEFPGRFNALAYDPKFTGKETTAQIAARYGQNPPYLEHLTDRSLTDNFVDVTNSKTAICMS